MAKKTAQAARGGATKQKQKTAAPPGSGRASEIIGIILIAMGVFSGYIIWNGSELGEALMLARQALRGAAGMISYALPVMLGGLGVIMMFVGRGRVKPLRALLTVMAALVFCGIWHVFSAGSIEQTMISGTYREFIRASYREGATTCEGAGALGALASWYPYTWLGKWGAAIALMGVLAILAACLSRTSMREMGERLSERIAGGMDDYRQRRQVRGREKAELRAQSLERRVAREERERERREERERLLAEEREKRATAESRVDELERRRRELTRAGDEVGDDDEEIPVKKSRVREKRAAPPPEESAPPQEAAPEPEPRPDAPEPVAEDALESVKARSRGDQEAYNQALRQHMAQEGVPMFLDKRVPGRVLTSAGAAPARPAAGAATEGARMVFQGYDEPGAARRDDSPSYAPKGYEMSPLPEPAGAVLDLGDAQQLPEDSRAEELIGSARAVPSESDVTMRPLRSVRDMTQDEQRAAHGSVAMRRIAGSRLRSDSAREETPRAAQEGAPQRLDYDDELRPARPGRTLHAPVSDSAPVFEPRPAAQASAPESREPARPVRRAVSPVPGSAYAAATDYEDGMPFERYGEPAAVSADAPADLDEPLAPGQGDLPEYAAADEPDGGLADYDESSLAAGDARAAEPASDARAAEAAPHEAEPDGCAELPDEDIAFDGYAGEGGVNEEIAVQHTPEIVPDTAARVAMYTPVAADLDRQFGSGTRPDGTPIRMPRPAMEEIPEDKPYFYPPLDLLQFSQTGGVSLKEQQQLDGEKALKLEQTLQSFGIQAKVVGVSRGPAITRFEMTPAPGVRVSKISGLADDIALNLAATTVRIEAPIPGKSAVGIELPNEQREMVTLRDVLDSPEARKAQSKLAVALGKDNAGKLVIADIAKMPHVLIAGATGSGKSVCINTIIMSIIYRATPDEVRLILIDPKVVELSVYNGVPHLLVPVVTDPKKAASALNWAVLEMTERYQKFAERGVRDIKGFNHNLRDGEKPLPQIVVIIDELADLMMVAPGEVEDAICRLAQLARAAGIHLVIATQRPSVNVITGVIKANIPSRIAFTVASQVDSRTILDGAGAEKLLGRGDMLFFPQGVSKPQRVQGANVTDDEVNAVTEFIKSQHEAVYNPDILEQMENADQPDAEKEEQKDDERDPLLPQAVELAVELGQVSISMLQRRMRIGYARAGRIVDEMTQRGIIGAADGAKPRMLLITREEFKRLYGDNQDN